MLNKNDLELLVTTFVKALASQGHAVVVAVTVSDSKVFAGMKSVKDQDHEKLIRAIGHLYQDLGLGTVFNSNQEALKAIIDDLEIQPGKK